MAEWHVRASKAVELRCMVFLAGALGLGGGGGGCGGGFLWGCFL